MHVIQFVWQIMDNLVSKESVELCWWRNETQKLHVKQVDKSQITTVERLQSSQSF